MSTDIPDVPATTLDALKALRAILEPEGAWTTGDWVAVHDGRTVCYCLAGGARRACGWPLACERLFDGTLFAARLRAVVFDSEAYERYEGVLAALAETLLQDGVDVDCDTGENENLVVSWNDEADRRKDEVLSLVDRTIARLEGA